MGSLAYRAVSVYLIFILLTLTFFDYKKVFTHARSASLGRLSFSFEYLIDCIKKNQKLDQKILGYYQHYFEKLIDIMPNTADTYGVLGFVYYRLGEQQKAIWAYQKAIERYPKYFTFLHNLGLLYFKGGDFPKAIESFTKALQVTVSESLFLAMSSQIYNSYFISLDSKDLNSEIKTKFSATYRQNYLMLVLSYFRMKDFKAMFYYANEAIELGFQPQSDFYFYAGIASYQLKEYERAVYLFQECTKMDSDYTDAFYYLGLSLKALGKEELAVKTIRKSVVLYNTIGSRLGKEDRVELEIY